MNESLTSAAVKSIGWYWPLVLCHLLWGGWLAAQEVAPLDPVAMAAELSRLDGICTKLKLQDEQQLTRHWLVKDLSDAQILYLPLAADPLASRQSHGERNNASSDSNWLKAFGSARSRHAQYWYDQAKKHSSQGDEWPAYLALWHAAREDATHADAKRVLGPLLAGLNIKGKPRPVNTAHPQFGWPGGSYVRMETANFKVTSHSDPKTTLEIAQKLEQFYALWTQAFYPLWAPPNVTSGRLAGRNTNWSKRNQIDVVICKDREDYLKTLGVGESNIGVSVGYYSPEGQLSFFYPDPNLDATLYHELTHQLLAEASQLKGSSQAGKSEGFWLVEAIALYMESLTDCEDHWRLGGWLAPRMQSARYRSLHDGFWVESDKLQALTLETWKNEKELGQLYTHSAGLAHFFLDRRLPATADEMQPPDDAQAQAGREHLDQYDSDKSKATFFRAIVATYQGQAVDKQFWDLLGDDAQRGYVHFLLVRDRHVQSLAEPSAVPELCTDLVLSRSYLTAKSWQSVAAFRRTKWLDLSFSNAGSSDLQWLDQLTDLERLSLEGLTIDSDTLKQLAKLSKLKELDLASCAIDDAQLQTLGRLAALETLWLSGTKVSAASQEWLRSQPKLKQVSLEQTEFTPAEAKALTQELANRR